MKSAYNFMYLCIDFKLNNNYNKASSSENLYAGTPQNIMIVDHNVHNTWQNYLKRYILLNGFRYTDWKYCVYNRLEEKKTL